MKYINYFNEKYNYNIYKNDLNKSNISKELHEWLINWMWNIDHLRHFQNYGVTDIKELIPNVYEEMLKFRPKKEIEVYRVFDTIEEEIKSRKNKIISYTYDFDLALNMVDGDSYIHFRNVKPNEVLISTQNILNKENIDLIPEIIIINK